MSASNGDNSTSTSNGFQQLEPGEHRSPCPALNALANGGFIPRDGRVTSAQLAEAIHKHLGVIPSIGKNLAEMAMARLGKLGPDGQKVLDLADLALHGFIEHDASLTRRDAREGDAAELAEPLLEQLLSFSKDGKTITLEDLAVAHQVRVAQSSAGGHRVPVKALALGTLEAALLFTVLSRGGAIATEDLEEFLRNERVPASLAPREIGRFPIFRNAILLAVTGNVPLFEAAKRAQKAVRELVGPGAAGCPVAQVASSSQVS